MVSHYLMEVQEMINNADFDTTDSLHDWKDSTLNSLYRKNLFSSVGVINVVVASPCNIPNINCNMMY